MIIIERRLDSRANVGWRRGWRGRLRPIKWKIIRRIIFLPVFVLARFCTLWNDILYFNPFNAHASDWYEGFYTRGILVFAYVERDPKKIQKPLSHAAIGSFTKIDTFLNTPVKSSTSSRGGGMRVQCIRHVQCTPKSGGIYRQFQYYTFYISFYNIRALDAARRYNNKLLLFKLIRKKKLYYFISLWQLTRKQNDYFQRVW